MHDLDARALDRPRRAVRSDRPAGVGTAARPEAVRTTGRGVSTGLDEPALPAVLRWCCPQVDRPVRRLDGCDSNPQAGNGLQAVKDFFTPAGPVDVEVHRVIADGDLVAVHSNYKTWNMAGVDIFRVNEGWKDRRALGMCCSKCLTQPPAGTTCSRSSARPRQASGWRSNRLRHPTYGPRGAAGQAPTAPLRTRDGGGGNRARQ